MVHLVNRVRNVISSYKVVAIFFIFVFVINSAINAQSKSGGLNALPAIASDRIGDLHYDITKEKKVLTFIDDLNNKLSGVNGDLFQVKYKFNEEYVRKWTTQYIADGVQYNIKDLEPGFAMIRKMTSDSYNVLSSLCGLNYKAEVLSYKPDYADPNKLSYMVKLKLKLTSPSDEDQLMSLILGYIDGKFLVFNVEKGAL